jgi:hypothetical protein
MVSASSMPPTWGEFPRIGMFPRVLVFDPSDGYGGNRTDGHSPQLHHTITQEKKKAIIRISP